MIDGKFIGKPVVQLVDYFKKCEWNQYILIKINFLIIIYLTVIKYIIGL